MAVGANLGDDGGNPRRVMMWVTTSVDPIFDLPKFIVSIVTLYCIYLTFNLYVDTITTINLTLLFQFFLVTIQTFYTKQFTVIMFYCNVLLKITKLNLFS